MSILAVEPLCKSHMSIQMIVILDFGETLMMCSLDATLMLSKM